MAHFPSDQAIIPPSYTTNEHLGYLGHHSNTHHRTSTVCSAMLLARAKRVTTRGPRPIRQLQSSPKHEARTKQTYPSVVSVCRDCVCVFVCTMTFLWAVDRNDPRSRLNWIHIILPPCFPPAPPPSSASYVPLPRHTPSVQVILFRISFPHSCMVGALKYFGCMLLWGWPGRQQ